MTISTLALGTDSTGLRRRLRRTEDNLRLLAEALPNSCFYVNRHLHIEFANSEFAASLGRTVDEIMGLPVREVLGERLYELHGRRLEAALRGQTQVYHAKVKGPLDDRARHLKISNKPVHDGEGTIVGVLSLAVDVTELSALELKAREDETRFRLLAQGVPNYFIYLDRKLHVAFCNDHFLRMTGWSMKDALGRHVSELLGPKLYEERREHYERALRGETVTYESQGAVGDQQGYFRFQYQPSYDDEGEIRGLFSMALDISERRRVELELERKQAELLRSNQDLEQFAYVASHDLKAPLRAIELLVHWIQEDLGGQEIGDVQENLTVLAQRSQRLTRLLDDLLAYSRAGRRVGEHTVTDTHALVRDIVQLLAPPENFEVEIEGTLPTFATYAAPLEQVFRNLIGNAIKHHPGPRGRITVSCEDEGERYLFSVRDDGAGIPDEYAERVFQMFQTLKPRDEIEGSGMGLAIVQRIVTWQGGRVWFEHGPDGRGTVFKFSWSRRPPAPALVECAERE